MSIAPFKPVFGRVRSIAPDGWTNIRKENSVLTSVHLDSLQKKEKPKTEKELWDITSRKLNNWKEARKTVIKTQDVKRINMVVFPEFWCLPTDIETHGGDASGTAEYMPGWSGSEPLPSNWLKSYIPALQQEARDMTKITGELHVIVCNMVTVLSDDKGKPILMIDPGSNGKPRRQACNQTFWVEPDNIQSFRKHNFSNIDEMEHFGNHAGTTLQGKKDEESRGYIELLDGGVATFANRICLDITKDFDEVWVDAPHFMAVQSYGNPPTSKWQMSTKPGFVLVNDNQKSQNGVYAVSDEQWKNVPKQPNAKLLGKVLLLAQDMVSMSMEKISNLFASKAVRSSEYFKVVPANTYEYTSKTYGKQKTFVIHDVPIKNAVTEKDLDGAAKVLIDGNWIYTQPIKKTSKL